MTNTWKTVMLSLATSIALAACGSAHAEPPRIAFRPYLPDRPIAVSVAAQVPLSPERCRPGEIYVGGGTCRVAIGAPVRLLPERRGLILRRDVRRLSRHQLGRFYYQLHR